VPVIGTAARYNSGASRVLSRISLDPAQGPMSFARL
jgi:hypothetical protein